MRAIAPRSVGLLLLAAAPLVCSEPADAIAQLASALSQNNAVVALQVFDSKMQGYSSIESNIEALVGQTEILCAIDVVDEKQTADTRELDVDWYMQLKSQLPNGPTERRRERVTLTMKLAGAKWKIVSLSLPKILAPISVL